MQENQQQQIPYQVPHKKPALTDTSFTTQQLKAALNSSQKHSNFKQFLHLFQYARRLLPQKSRKKKITENSEKIQTKKKKKEQSEMIPRLKQSINTELQEYLLFLRKTQLEHTERFEKKDKSERNPRLDSILTLSPFLPSTSFWVLMLYTKRIPYFLLSLLLFSFFFPPSQLSQDSTDKVRFWARILSVKFVCFVRNGLSKNKGTMVFFLYYKSTELLIVHQCFCKLLMTYYPLESKGLRGGRWLADRRLIMRYTVMSLRSSYLIWPNILKGDF